MARWREQPGPSLRERARAELGWDPGTDADLLWLAEGLLGESPEAAGGQVLALAPRQAPLSGSASGLPIGVRGSDA